MGGVVPIIYNFRLNSANIDSSKKVGLNFFQKNTCYKPTHQENIFNGFGYFMIQPKNQRPVFTVGLHDLQIALQQLLQKFTASHWDHTILSKFDGLPEGYPQDMPLGNIPGKGSKLYGFQKKT